MIHGADMPDAAGAVKGGRTRIMLVSYSFFWSLHEDSIEL